jgi:hypothetical protein
MHSSIQYEVSVAKHQPVWSNDVGCSMASSSAIRKHCVIQIFNVSIMNEVVERVSRLCFKLDIL